MKAAPHPSSHKHTMSQLSSLPILSLSHLRSGSPDSLAALNEACTKAGFFYLTDHGIPAARLTQILELARTFFLNATETEKNALARRDPDSARGYQRLGENVTKGKRDAHEAIDLYVPWPAGKPADGGVLTGENLWPDQPRELRAEIEAYIEEVKHVGLDVVSAMARALGIGEEDEEWKELVGQVGESFWVARLIGYPQLDDGSDGVSCGEHTGM
jgi:isopenicillin N synthase-like dioxygenase